MDPYSGYLRVNLHELEAQRADRRFNHFAGGFEYPPRGSTSERTAYAYHTFERSPYLKLKQEVITKLEVTIANAIGEPIKDDIYSGPPTIVLFDISDEMESDNFTISCNSRHPNFYSTNKLTDFTSPLHSQMDLSKHQVALVNVVYPPSLSEKTVASMTINGQQFDYILDDLVHTWEFITRVRTDVAEGEFGRALYFDILSNGEHRGRAVLGRREGDEANRDLPDAIPISFSRTFTMACGQLHDFKSSVSLEPGNVIVFVGDTPNINIVKPNPIAVLHCDIVKNGVVGDSFSNLLACVPVLTENSAGRNRLHEAGQLIYYDVVSRPVNSISFQFTNPDGSARNFVSGEDDKFNNIIVTLAFRMKREHWMKLLMKRHLEQEQKSDANDS